MKNHLTPETENLIYQLYTKDKKSIKAISKMLEIPRRKVRAVLEDEVPKIEKFSQEQVNKVIHLYKSGKNSAEIQEITNIKKTTILYWLKKNNVQIRHRGPKSKISREDFFDNIDSEEKAYYLGWIMADGNISITNNQYCLKVGVSIVDEDIILKFMKAIGSTNKIRYVTPKKGKGAGKTYVLVSLSSKHMCESLMKLGVIPAKSGYESFPNIPKDLEHHFVRGFFDGDGITCITRGRKRAGFISSERLLKAIQEKTNLPKKIHHNSDCINQNVCYYLLNKQESIKLYDYMYKDATIWMNRKKARMDYICDNTEITGKIKKLSAS